MARMLSQIASVIRGSAGGATFTSNKHSRIILRARTIPTNPMTNNQDMIRSAFAGSISLWKGLTDAQRNDWEVYASSCHRSGPTGQRTLSGREAFLGNITMAGFLIGKGLIAGPLTLTAPITFGFLPFRLNGVNPPQAPGTGFSVDATNIGDETIEVITSRTGIISPSRTAFIGPYLQSSYVATELAAGASDDIEYTNVSADEAQFVRIRAISKVAPFRISQEYVMRAVSSTVAP